MLYAKDVEAVAAFYVGIGFEEHVRMPGPDGSPGFIGLRRDGGGELAVTTEESPRMLAGVEPGPGPRGELFVYVADVDATVAGLDSVLRAGRHALGERVAFVTDPEGNIVTLAQAA